MLEPLTSSRYLLLLSVFFLTTLLSCGPAHREQTEISSKNSIQVEESLPAFAIESKEFSAQLRKASIDIRLKKQISESEIKTIANKIKNDFPGYDKYFIFYWLPGIQLGTGAWATSHFTPNLTVNMIGATAQEETKMKGGDLMPDGEIIGKWYDGRAGVEKTIIIYKVAKQFKYRDIYPDGSFGDEHLNQSGSKYVYPNTFGEYFRIENDGNLGWYSSNGRFAVAKKID